MKSGTTSGGGMTGSADGARGARSRRPPRAKARARSGAGSDARPGATADEGEVVALGLAQVVGGSGSGHGGLGVAGGLGLDLGLGPGLVAELLDHVPDLVFFVKDRAGRYLAVNSTLAERCGSRGRGDLVGRHVRDVFPPALAARYAAQDDDVLRTGRAILDRLELHFQARGREGWCLTTKLPVRGADGSILGLVGISRDLRAPGERGTLPIPAGLLGALEFLESAYAGTVTPPILARKAGLSPARFARLIKRIHRLTPSQLIAQTRLAAASRLLRETDRGVADVALACGFYDHSAFTRAFRSATGLTPTEFRAER